MATLRQYYEEYPSSNFVFFCWQLPQIVLQALWYGWLDTPDYHIIALLLLPPTLFWYSIERLRTNYPDTHASCNWQTPSWLPKEMQNVSSPCPIDKHFLETPTQPVCLLAYALSSLALVFFLVAYRNRPRTLLQISFWLHFLVTVAIRCLSSFSGLTTKFSWPSLIWNSNSPGKLAWLWILVEWPLWNCTYLGFYEDYYFEEGTRTVYDRVGRPVWIFTSEKIGDEEVDRSYHPYGFIFRPWQDIAVRLSYYHVFDNTIHVLWLRYFSTDTPYTTYINNSEFLTMALFVTLAVYTYARMRTHVYFNDDERGLLVDIKSPIPLPTQSASRDLITFASSKYDFRTPTMWRCACMVCVCVLSTGASATWNMDEAVPLIWGIVTLLGAYWWMISDAAVINCKERVLEERLRKEIGCKCEHVTWKWSGRSRWDR